MKRRPSWRLLLPLAMLCSTSVARATELPPPGPRDLCQEEQRIETQRANESMVAVELDSPGRADARVLRLAAANATLACRLEAYERFWQLARTFVAPPRASFSDVLAKLGLLSTVLDVKNESLAAAQGKFRQAFGHTLTEFELLLKQLHALRSELLAAHAQQAQQREELYRARRELDEKERMLRKAMPEVARVVDYQNQVLALRDEVTRLNVELEAQRKREAMARAALEEDAKAGAANPPRNTEPTPNTGRPPKKAYPKQRQLANRD